MRVDINMGTPLRGLVRHYADEHDLTMPQAYSSVLKDGLDANGYDTDSINNLPGGED